MTRKNIITLLLAVALVIPASAFAGAKITIQNQDAAGFGFNDATPAQPVGGNPGRTLGELRLNAFKRAAEVWSQHLESDVEIVIAARFATLACSSNSAVLGQAGPTAWSRDFENAPLPGTFYPVALANKLSGRDLNGATPEISSRFNTFQGTGCGFKWYYGFDGNEGDGEDLVVVLMHEFAHGLGFSSSSSLTEGTSLQGVPSAYERNIRDLTSNKTWDQMSAAERISSSVNDQNVVWVGPEVKRRSLNHLQGSPFMTVNSPAPIAKQYNVGIAAFSARIPTSGFNGSLAAATDAAEPAEGDTAAGTATDGCSDYANPAAVIGKIAFIDRGRCTFIEKARKAQAAGAVGLLIANNQAGIINPSGGDPAITIPVLTITQADGAAIRAQLAGGVNVTFGADALKPAGATVDGFVRLYAPAELATGSSIHHWDTSALPNLLMEPNINDDLSATGVDLTLPFLLDLGWTTSIQQGQNPAQPAPGPAPGRRILRRGR